MRPASPRSQLPRTQRAAGTNHLERDLELALLVGARVGSIAAGMSFVGAWAERKRMTRVARAAADLAVS
jgi:hypothetical protein